jgi:predicted dehydrogenase
MAYDRKKISRRKFLAKTTKSVAGFTTAAALTFCTQAQSATKPAARVIGANDRINLAVIGIRSRGNSIAKKFAAIDNVNIKTLCDVDENLFDKRAKTVEQIQGTAPGTEFDLRRVYDDKDIDAVIIATPEHWHALATIWACQAGKHVYVEKPSCHKIWEGQKMVEAAKKYDRAVAVGFQYRSLPSVQSGIKFLHDGGIGELYMVRCPIFKPRDSFGRKPNGPVPKGVHYDLWLGPAPKRPFNPNRFHYNWNWMYDYGSGDVVANGAHMFDITRWALQKEDYPRKIKSLGGYLAFDCDQETANTQLALFEYADGKIIQLEVRGLYTNREENIMCGNLFYGTKGWMSMNQGDWKTYLGRKNEPGPSWTSENTQVDTMNLTGTGGERHYDNFIQVLRSGRKQDLACDIQTGHRSSVIGHLANVSYHLGREVTFDSKTETFVNDKQANKMLMRKQRKPYIVPRNV